MIFKTHREAKEAVRRRGLRSWQIAVVRGPRGGRRPIAYDLTDLERPDMLGLTARRFNFAQ